MLIRIERIRRANFADLRSFAQTVTARFEADHRGASKISMDSCCFVILWIVR